MSRMNVFFDTVRGVLARVPDGKNDEISWPEGIKFWKCRQAPSGHWYLVISAFENRGKDLQYKPPQSPKSTPPSTPSSSPKKKVSRKGAILGRLAQVQSTWMRFRFLGSQSSAHSFQTLCSQSPKERKSATTVRHPLVHVRCAPACRLRRALPRPSAHLEPCRRSGRHL